MDATSTLEVATQLGNASKSAWQNSKTENTAWRTPLDLVRLCLSLKLFSKFEFKFGSFLTIFRTAIMLLQEMTCMEVPTVNWISALPSTESSSPWLTHETPKMSVMHYVRTPSLFGSKPPPIPYFVSLIFKVCQSKLDSMLNFDRNFDFGSWLQQGYRCRCGQYFLDPIQPTPIGPWCRCRDALRH